MKRILLITAAALAVAACGRQGPVDPDAQRSSVTVEVPPAIATDINAAQQITTRPVLDDGSPVVTDDDCDASGRCGNEIDEHSEEVYQRQQADAKTPGTLAYAAEQHQCAGHDTMVQRLAAQGLRWNHTDNGDDVYTDGTTVVRIRDNGGIDCIVA